MNSAGRLFVCVLVCGLAYCAIYLPKISFEPKDGWSRDLRMEAALEGMTLSQRSDMLDAELLQIKRVMVLKRQICAQVEAGEMLLLEAADRFRDLEAVTPHANHHYYQAHYPDASERERYGLQVIAQLLGGPDIDSPEAHVWLCRLFEELEKLPIQGEPGAVE